MCKTKILYRGFKAVVEKDEETGIHYGKVLDIPEMVYFDNSEQPLYRAFEETIDEYILSKLN